MMDKNDCDSETESLADKVHHYFNKAPKDWSLMKCIAFVHDERGFHHCSDIIKEFKTAVKSELNKIKDSIGMKTNPRNKAAAFLSTLDETMSRPEIISEFTSIRRQIDSEKSKKIYSYALKEKIYVDGVAEIDYSLKNKYHAEGNPKQKKRKEPQSLSDIRDNKSIAGDKLNSISKKIRSDKCDSDDDYNVAIPEYSCELSGLLNDDTNDVNRNLFDNLCKSFEAYSEHFDDDLTKERIADMSPESYMYLKQYYDHETWLKLTASECEPVDNYGPAEVKDFLNTFFSRQFSCGSWNTDLQSLLDFQDGESLDIRKTRIMLYQILPPYFEAIFSSHNPLRSPQTYESPYGVQYIYPLLHSILREFGELSFSGGDHPVAAAPSCERSDGIAKTKSGRELVTVELSRPIADQDKRIYDHVQLCRTMKDMLIHNLISDAISQRSIPSAPQIFGCQVHERMIYLGWIRFYKGIYWYIQYAKGYLPASPEELNNFSSILFDLICWSKKIGKYLKDYEATSHRKPSRKSSAMNLQKAFELKDSKVRISKKKEKYTAFMLT